MSEPNTTLIKLGTIADTTSNPEVRVLAETMTKYIKHHEKQHRVEVTQEIGYVPPAPTKGTD